MNLENNRLKKGYNIDCVVFERSDDIGGLWRYRDDDYGVMAFTHINVSKYNYCYSDHPFPNDSSDYPHHSEMYKYIKSYSDRFELDEIIHFNTEVLSIEGCLRFLL
jgi:dimethylaniline monooxygenase (N-oxide forming)